MTTNTIVKIIESITGLNFQLGIDEINANATYNPEKLNYEYFNICNNLETYFTELYLDNNSLVLEKLLPLLNEGLSLWSEIKNRSFYININFESKEYKHLQTQLTGEELKKVSEIKTYYIESLISTIERLKAFGKVKNSISEKKSTVDVPEKSISFNSPDTVNKLFDELKGYFPEQESELLKALQGEQLNKLLYFPHNQNKFVEVFKRLKYNGFILSTPTEIKNWICLNFVFNKRHFNDPQPFNENTVRDILTKDKGEPAKKERICQPDWLPYKGSAARKREADKEQL